MGKIFKIIEEEDPDSPNGIKIWVAIDLRQGEVPLSCPITDGAENFDEISKQISQMQDELEELKKEAEQAFSLNHVSSHLIYPVDMPAQDMWERLQKIEQEDEFISRFNSLPDFQREAIASYVFAHCNVFSGKGSVFLSRYNNKSMLLE